MTGRRIARGAVLAAVTGAALLVAVLAVAWSRAAAMRRAPRLADGMFVVLSNGRTPAGREDAERWLVAVNLRCGHCRDAFERTAASARACAGAVRVTALLVDTAHPPAAGAMPAGEVWWDARQVWRNGWGRRAYGEVLCFDRSGRCVRVLPPE